MSEAKHTPGPWHINEECEGIFNRKCLYVCDVPVANENAHLIVAAPDLLSEHEEWSELLGEVKIALLQGDREEALHMLEAVEVVFGPRDDGGPSAKSAAIAKAKGESQ